MATRVKICGITSPEDALTAASAGADAIGLVFYGRSIRKVDVVQAAEIASVLPPFVDAVALFVNAEIAEVEAVLDSVPIQLLQFHGDEPPEYCESFALPYIKALRVGRDSSGLKSGGLNGDTLRIQMDSYTGARGILLDTYRKGSPGGTGEQFDWDLVPDTGQPVILAGGLNPDNVGNAIQKVMPYAVDVSGGVESAPGVKDAGRIRAFLSAVQLADH